MSLSSLVDSSSEAEVTALVSGIAIEGLHGLYDYDLSLALGPDGNATRLALLYGDNGSGKTTILRLLWDILSPSNNNGHRSRISQVEFKTCIVRLTNDHSIKLSRELPVAGPYVVELRHQNSVLSRSNWPDKGGLDDYFEGWEVEGFEERLLHERKSSAVREAGKRVLEKKKYIEFLESIGSAPFFLADDRSTASDEFIRDIPEREARSRRLADDSSRGQARRLAVELETSIRRANNMLQSAALGGAASGSANANSVYLDVIRHIGSPAAASSVDARTERKAILREIEKVSARTLDVEKYGLIPRFVAADFTNAIRDLDDSRVEIASSVLRPYLESTAARLDALNEVHWLISTLITKANEFLTGKQLTYNSRLGLRIRLDSGAPLKASQLSSGECHLILLLCNALLAREGSKLFLIDEPELSLNVKWQRKVVAALLECTRGSDVQFVIATHSIELLSSFKSYVVRMDNGGKV